MLKTGILNPQLNSLLSRVRHTNTLVIADRGFPFWPGVETVDLSLVDDIPRVLDVLQAIQWNWVVGRIWMAEEFRHHNAPGALAQITGMTYPVPIAWESHADLKKRVPSAIG